MPNLEATRARRVSLTIPPGAGGRLDRALADLLAGSCSRSEIARLIRSERVELEGRRAKPSSEVRPGDRVWIEFPPPVPSELPAEELPIRILFEDEHLAVVEKPAGMVTHPAGALRTGTLVNALLARIGDLSGIGGVLRPGIVHRLDKGTSGLLVVAKHDESHRRLADQIAGRRLRRTYEAVAWGRIERERFDVEAPIGRHPRDRKRMAVVEGGRSALSRVRVLRATPVASHVQVELATGRTHQIRVHLRHAGHPLVGDAQYGGRRRALRSLAGARRAEGERLLAAIERPALHARRIEFPHPFTGRRLSFSSPLPRDLRALLALLPGCGPLAGEIG